MTDFNSRSIGTHSQFELDISPWKPMEIHTIQQTVPVMRTHELLMNEWVNKQTNKAMFGRRKGRSLKDWIYLKDPILNLKKTR